MLVWKFENSFGNLTVSVSIRCVLSFFFFLTYRSYHLLPYQKRKQIYSIKSNIRKILRISIEQSIFKSNDKTIYSLLVYNLCKAIWKEVVQAVKSFQTEYKHKYNKYQSMECWRLYFGIGWLSFKTCAALNQSLEIFINFVYCKHNVKVKMYLFQFQPR